MGAFNIFDDNCSFVGLKEYSWHRLTPSRNFAVLKVLDLDEIKKIGEDENLYSIEDLRSDLKEINLALKIKLTNNLVGQK